MHIIWDIPDPIRADFILYKTTDLQGGRKAVRLYPSGRKGNVAPEELHSMVVRAPHGTRITLMTHAGTGWMEHPWRVVRLVEGSTVPGDKTPLPGVRVPDLDFLDEPTKKRSSKDFQESYRLVAHPDEGEGWTFGRVGAEELKGHVRKIRVERE